MLVMCESRPRARRATVFSPGEAEPPGVNYGRLFYRGQQDRFGNWSWIVSFVVVSRTETFVWTICFVAFLSVCETQVGWFWLFCLLRMVPRWCRLSEVRSGYLVVCTCFRIGFGLFVRGLCIVSLLHFLHFCVTVKNVGFWIRQVYCKCFSVCSLCLLGFSIIVTIVRFWVRRVVYKNKTKQNKTKLSLFGICVCLFVRCLVIYTIQNKLRTNCSQTCQRQSFELNDLKF